jgi:hypothetical protein
MLNYLPREMLPNRAYVAIAAVRTLLYTQQNVKPRGGSGH